MNLRGKKLLLLISFILSVFMLTVVSPAAGADNYQPLRAPVVGDGAVYESGLILARFTPGQLQRNDTVVFSLPEGFIWTTAATGSGQAAASAASQTTAEWNTVTAATYYARYGTANYIEIPQKYSGDDNGLYQGAVPVFNIARIDDNEIRVELIEEPVANQECFFYIYLNRIYVEDGYRGNFYLAADTPPGSGFAGGSVTGGRVSGSGAHPDTKIECKSVPTLRGGMPGQKIGTIVITEGAGASISNERTLTLQLPAGARWKALDEDSNNNLSIKIKSSSGSDGRTAEFKFVGASGVPATLELKDMEVELEPSVSGSLKVKAGGTAGLSGELEVAEITAPAAVFTVGQTKYYMNSVEKTMDAAPYLKEDRVYLPLRFVCKALGVDEADIVWNQAARSVEVRKGGNVARLSVGGNIIYINNVPFTMDVAPEIIEPGRTMVPLRWIAQAVGVEISWDAANKRVIVR